MAQTLGSARPAILEFTLAGANVFTQVNLPPNLGTGKLTLYLSSTGYFCYEGSDGGTRSTQPRMVLPGGYYIEMDRLAISKFYIAGNAGGESVHIHCGDSAPVVVRD